MLHVPAARRAVLRSFATMIMCVAVFIIAVACTAQQAKTAIEAGVQALVNETCQEVEGNAGLSTDVVALTCPLVGEAGAGVIQVVMPRAEWLAVKARRIDAGPGK